MDNRHVKYVPVVHGTSMGMSNPLCPGCLLRRAPLVRENHQARDFFWNSQTREWSLGAQEVSA